MDDAALSKLPTPFDRRLARFVTSRKLGLRLAIIALLLSSPCLFLGFHLDDYVGRYIYSDLPGAAHMFELYSGGYALANGNPADNHWQIEEGWAPWWTYDKLLLRMARPLGVATHWLDFELYPEQPWLMHLHNLLWLAVLVLATTRMYRAALGPLAGGLAALLFAFDHTHGFVVGYIANRHSLITALLGVWCLHAHLQARAENSTSKLLGAYALYAAAITSGESAIAIVGYVCAHALCVERTSLMRRALVVAPYVAITIVWRGIYTHAGYGAFGSGLYLDPGRDPVSYFLALLERAPVLVLGQFLAPPAELYSVWPTPWAHAMFALACVFSVCLCAAFWPLFRRDRTARFWILGALASLVPAASTYAHNRQLLFASFGAMGALAQLWNMHVVELQNRAPSPLFRFSQLIGGTTFAAHCVISPLVMPISTCGIAITSPLKAALAPLGDVADRDVVFVNAPDYFALKLPQLGRRLAREPLPRHFRALSVGPEHITVQRTAANVLQLEYAEGVLSTPFMELYRDRHIPMHPGDKVELDGLHIEVLDVTPDQRARKVNFQFDSVLEADPLRFYVWSNGHYIPFKPPPLGAAVQLTPAKLELGF